MDKEKIKKILLIAITLSIVMAGYTLYRTYYNLKNETDIEIAVETTDKRISKNTTRSQEKDTNYVEIKLNKVIFDFFKKINNGQYEEAYSRINTEYKMMFNYQFEEFKAIYKNDEHLNFVITDYKSYEDRYILDINIYRGKTMNNIHDEIPYTRAVFTIFIEDNNSIADTGIYFTTEIGHLEETEEIKIRIYNYINTNQGAFYELEIENKTRQEIIISDIVGEKNAIKVPHKIENANFLDYKIGPLQTKHYIILFEHSQKLDSLVIEINESNKIIIN